MNPNDAIISPSAKASPDEERLRFLMSLMETDDTTLRQMANTFRAARGLDPISEAPPAPQPTLEGVRTRLEATRHQQEQFLPGSPARTLVGLPDGPTTPEGVLSPREAAIRNITGGAAVFADPTPMDIITRSPEGKNRLEDSVPPKHNLFVRFMMGAKGQEDELARGDRMRALRDKGLTLAGYDLDVEKELGRNPPTPEQISDFRDFLVNMPREAFPELERRGLAERFKKMPDQEIARLLAAQKLDRPQQQGFPKDVPINIPGGVEGKIIAGEVSALAQAASSIEGILPSVLGAGRQIMNNPAKGLLIPIWLQNAPVVRDLIHGIDEMRDSFGEKQIDGVTLDDLDTAFANAINEFQAGAEATANIVPPPQGVAGQLGSVVAQALPSMAAVRLANAGRAIESVLAFYALQSASQTGLDYRRVMQEKGKDPDTVAGLAIAVGNGMLEAGFEKLGLERGLIPISRSTGGQIGDLLLRGNAPAAGRVAGTLAGSAGVEGTEELLTQFFQNILNKAYDPSVGLMDGVIESGLYGAVPGPFVTMMGGKAGDIAGTRERWQRGRHAVQQNRRLRGDIFIEKMRPGHEAIQAAEQRARDLPESSDFINLQVGRVVEESKQNFSEEERQWWRQFHRLRTAQQQSAREAEMARAKEYAAIKSREGVLAKKAEQFRRSDQDVTEPHTTDPAWWYAQGLDLGESGSELDYRMIPDNPDLADSLAIGYQRGLERHFGVEQPIDETKPTEESIAERSAPALPATPWRLREYAGTTNKVVVGGVPRGTPPVPLLQESKDLRQRGEGSFTKAGDSTSIRADSTSIQQPPALVDTPESRQRVLVKGPLARYIQDIPPIPRESGSEGNVWRESLFDAIEARTGTVLELDGKDVMLSALTGIVAEKIDEGDFDGADRLLEELTYEGPGLFFETATDAGRAGRDIDSILNLAHRGLAGSGAHGVADELAKWVGKAEAILDRGDSAEIDTLAEGLAFVMNGISPLDTEWALLDSAVGMLPETSGGGGEEGKANAKANETEDQAESPKRTGDRGQPGDRGPAGEPSIQPTQPGKGDTGDGGRTSPARPPARPNEPDDRTGSDTVPKEKPAPGRGKSRSGKAGRGGGGTRTETTEPARPEGVREGERRVGERSVPENVPDRNHRITNPDTLAPRGVMGKADANISAIRLLRTLESEDRNPTPDEKAILARYTGWGGLKPMFDRIKSQRVESYNRYVSEHPDRADYYSLDTATEQWNKKWGGRAKTLQDLLTKEEWEEAASTMHNAHYTSGRVIQDLIWPIAQRIGFNGGSVLEPGSGIGHMIGLVPKTLAQKTDFIGVEMDGLSARIASKLYPESKIINAKMQDAKVPPASMDMVIGNVPFADTMVADGRYSQAFALHNYMLARSIDALKPGGVLVAISSTSTLDGGKSIDFRRWAAKQADFMGAVRLPRETFDANANTKVVTDLLVFRKRQGPPHQNAHEWVGTATVQVKRQGAVGTLEREINTFLAANPSMILGEMVTGRGMYSDDELMVTIGDVDRLYERFPDAIRWFPKDVFSADESAPPRIIEDTGHKEGSYQRMGGVFGRVVDGALVEIQPGRTRGTTKRDIARIGDFIDLRDQTRRLLDAEIDPESTDEQLDAMRAKLNATYEAAIKNAGVNLLDKAWNFLRSDPESGIVFALERTELATADDGKGHEKLDHRFVKSDILSFRTRTPTEEPTTADSLEDAIFQSAIWKARIDLPWIARLLGADQDTIKSRFVDEGHGFQDPADGNLVLADEYLSGNVVRKLEQARKAAEADGAYKRNVTALEEVQPKPIPIEDIGFQVGSQWIHPDIYKAWVADLLDIESPDDVGSIDFIPETGHFIVKWAWQAKHSAAADAWTGGGIHPLSIIESSLHQKEPTAKKKEYYTDDAGRSKSRDVKDPKATEAARAMLQKMHGHFQAFIRHHATLAERAERDYNKKFNNTVRRQWNAPAQLKHFPGANRTVKLRRSQIDAVFRGLQESFILGHGVGLGKTYVYATLAMEQRRLGLAKKPMIVVHNATLVQFVEQFQHLYPGGRLLFPSQNKDNNAKTRRDFLGRIATGDWDAVIIPQSMFNLIQDSKERMTAFINEQIAVLVDAAASVAAEDKKDPRVRDIQKRIDALREKLRQIGDRPTDPLMTFDHMGIDSLIVDEAHEYKKPFFHTQMQQIKGLDTGESMRGIVLQLRMQNVQDKTGGKNTVMGTGTPVTNTIAEVWKMVRFVRPDLIKEFGVPTFDDFASTFGMRRTEAELDATGRLKETTRFASFQNVPELINLFHSAADIRTTQDVEGLNLPMLKGGKPEVVDLDPTPAVEKYLAYLIARYEQFENMTGKARMRNRHIPLVINTLAKQVAIDIRLIDPTADPEPGSKLETAANRIASLWKETKGDRGAQVVFADRFRSPAEKKVMRGGEEISVPVTDRFNAFEALRDMLVERGIPRDEIAIIHDYDKGSKAKRDKARAELFQRVNAGSVRVLIGTTDKLGIGVNVQDRLYALHHLDAPDRPDQLEQREGRLIRHRDNSVFPHVEIIRYGVKRSFDSGQYERLAIKKAWQNDVLSGRFNGRVVDDFSAATLVGYREASAAIAGDPRIKERFELRRKVQRLEAIEMDHNARVSKARRDAARYRDNIVEYGETLERVRKGIPGVRESLDPDSLKITLGNDEYVGSKVVAKHIDKQIEFLRGAFEQFYKVHGDRAIHERVAGTLTFGGDEIPIILRASAPVDERTGLPQMDALGYSYRTGPSRSVMATPQSMSLASGQGFVRSIRSYREKLGGQTGELEARIKGSEKRERAAIELAQSDFDQADELAEARKKLGALESVLISEGEARSRAHKKNPVNPNAGVVASSPEPIAESGVGDHLDVTRRFLNDELESLSTEKLHEIHRKTEDSPTRRRVKKLLKGRGETIPPSRTKKKPYDAERAAKERVVSGVDTATDEVIRSREREIATLLNQPGIEFTTESESGSRYYKLPDGHPVRVADHEPTAATADWMERNDGISVRLDKKRNWTGGIHEEVESLTGADRTTRPPPGIGGPDETPIPEHVESTNPVLRLATKPGRRKERVPIDKIKGIVPKRRDEILLTLKGTAKTTLAQHRQPGRRGGAYKAWSGSASIKYEGDLTTAGHEAAHRLDDLYGIVAAWALDETSPFDAELVPEFSRFGSEPPRSLGDDEAAKAAYTRGEGVAEWFVAWFRNPDMAAKMAPKFYAHVMETLPSEVIEKLKTFSRDVRVLAGASALEQVSAGMAMDWTARDRKSRVKAARQALRASGAFDTSWVTTLRSEVLDSLQPVWDALKYAKKVHAIESLLPKQDPLILARLYAGVNKNIGATLEHGLGLFHDIEKLAPGVNGGLAWLAEPLSLPGDTVGTVRHAHDVAFAVMASQRGVEIAQRYHQEAVDRTVEMLTRTAEAAKEVLEEELRVANARGNTRRAADIEALMSEVPALLDRVSSARNMTQVMNIFNTAGDRAAKVLLTKGNAKRMLMLQRWARLSTDHLTGFGHGLIHDEDVAKAAAREYLEMDEDEKERIDEFIRRQRAWTDGLIRYMVDGGRMTQEQADQIRSDNEFYVSFRRYIESNVIPNSFGGSRRVARWRKVVHHLEGSTRPLENPLLSLIHHTQLTMRETARNRVLQQFVRLLEVKRGMHMGTANSLHSIGERLDRAPETERDHIIVWVNGEKQFWKFQGDIHAALNAWGDVDDPSLLVRAFSLPAKVLRVSIVNSLPFIGRNLPRDAMAGAILSRTGRGVTDVFWYLTPEGRKAFGRDLELFYRSGGGLFGHHMGSMNSYYKEMERAFRHVTKHERTIITSPKLLWDYWHRGAEISEVLGRLPEFRSALKYARETLGYDAEDAYLYASYQARDVMDFAVAGNFIRKLNQFVPFTNAAIRGVEKFIRTGYEDPLGMGTRWALRVGMMELISYLWSMWSGDEDEYKQLPAWQRDYFWSFKMGPDAWIRIAKPWEFGVVASGLTRAIDAARGLGHPFEGYTRSVGGAFSPVSGDVMVGPWRAVIEIITNYDTWLQRPVIPDYQRDLDIELREGTDRASRVGMMYQSTVEWANEQLGFHPMGIQWDARQIDHFIRGQFGTMGSFALKVADIGRDDRRGIDDEPLSIIGAEARSPVWGARDVTWVMRWARRRGETQIPEMRGLHDILVAYSTEKNKGRREALAKRARAYATRLREAIERSEGRK